jgi:phosphoribosylaminoimidazole-succinocarboxamide synthase
MSLDIYKKMGIFFLENKIILADTKFEFGFVWNRNRWTLCLIDEVLTPDSSRLWPYDCYEVGLSQNSMDKQILRNWIANNPEKEIPDYLKLEIYKIYESIYEMVCV